MTSTKIAQSLAIYGVLPNKTKTAKVLGLDKNRHFWRGMVDGDGHVRLSSRNQAVIGLTGTKEICLQFARFVRDVSSAKGGIFRNHSIWEMRAKCKPAAEIIRCLYDPCEIALPRKLEAAKKVLAFYSPYRP